MRPEELPPPTGQTVPARIAAPPCRTWRRVAEWLVDLATILAASAPVALTQAETFRPARALSADQQERIAELEASTSVALTLGDTLWIWAGDGLWITAAATIVVAVVVLMLVPANGDGRTPGMRVTGRRVITTSGHEAHLLHHAIRTLVGIVDLFPFVVPGLMGLYAVLADADGRRIGDRVAGTMVVDASHPVRRPDPAGALAPLGSPEPALRWTVPDGHPELDPSTASTVASSRDVSSVTEVLPPLDRRRRPAPDCAGTVGDAAASAAGRAESAETPPVIADCGAAGDRALTLADLVHRPPTDSDRRPEGGSDPVPDDDVTADPGEEARAETGSEVDGTAAAPSDAVGSPRREDAGEIVWSDEHEAWMYRDARTGRWLRHDPDAGSWVLA